MKLEKLLCYFCVSILFSAPVYCQGRSSSGDTSNPPILEQYDQAIDQVAERAMRSVVEVDVTGYSLENGSANESQTLQRQRALGTGVIVDPDGYIITNNHVVSGALRITVVLSPASVELGTAFENLGHKQRVYAATLIGTNRNTDLAVLKIDEHDLPAISLPLNFNVRLGQTVVAIGSPKGLYHTVTKGIVSAVGRQPDVDRPMIYVQTDAPINPGNSGGPLIDRAGNLIGINTFIYTSGGGSEGLGFAIPEPVVRFVYDEIKTHGAVRTISIGAHAQAITLPLAKGLNLPQQWGVLLSDIEPEGPAEHAGLQPKDIVISVDGHSIDSLPQYSAFLYLHPRGTPLDLRVLRGAKTVSVSVAPIDTLPTMDNLSDLVNPRVSLIAPLGLFTVDMNDFLAEGFSARIKSGVVVAALLNGEPSTVADLRVGDIIFAANGDRITGTKQLRELLETFKSGQIVVFELERQSVIQYVAFEME
jgi:serine protease Do